MKLKMTRFVTGFNLCMVQVIARWALFSHFSGRCRHILMNKSQSTKLAGSFQCEDTSLYFVGVAIELHPWGRFVAASVPSILATRSSLASWR
jgi:hypothetical protein